jgi:hypothetical protein
MRNNLFMSLESEDTGTMAPEDMVPAADLGAAEAAHEVDQVAGETQEVVASIEDATVAVDELTEQQEILGDTLAEGGDGEGEGASPATAAAVSASVESIRRRVGLSRVDRTKPIPSKENFASKGSRRQATRMSQEGVSDTLKSIWEAIKRGLRLLADKIRSFLTGLTGSAAQLEKHLSSLQDRVRKLGGDNEKAEKELSIGAAKAFTIDKKADKATAITVLENAAAIPDAARELSEQVVKLSGVAVGGAVKTEGQYFTAVKAAVDKAFSGLGKVSFSGKAGENEGDREYYGHLVEGRAISVVTKTSGVAELRLEFVSNTDGTADKIEALDPAGMSEVLKKALAVTSKLESIGNVEKALKSAVDKCTQAADKAIAAAKAVADDGKEKDKADELRHAAAAVRSLNGIMAKMGLDLPKNAFSAARAAGDYVSSSIANFKPKKK